jgi:hypothetical protein
MPADLVASIAGESEETRILREQLTRQLDVLMKGSETCKRFIGVRGLGERSTWHVPFCNPLLTCWTGADGRTIQGSDWFKSTGHDSSDHVEGSEDSLRRLGRTELLDKEITKTIDDSNVSEIPVPAFEEAIFYASSKRKSKKSKLATKWAVPEEISS